MFLSIDLGTSSVKAMLTDVQGQAVSVSSAGYAIDSPQEGWSETHPDSWWSAVIEAVNALDPDLRKGVRAAGFSGQMHGVVLCDRNANPLRPAILWLDTRGKDCLPLFPADAAIRSGNRPSAGMAAASLLWLRQRDPACYAQAAWALQPKDWLRLRLCGQVSTDPSEATGTLLANLDGEWDAALIAALGLRTDWLAPVIRSDAVAGELSAAAALALGLPPKIPLATGAADTAAAALGSGLLRDGAALLTTGTGGQIVAMRAARPVYHPELNTFRSANPVGFAPWYVMAAMLNVGSALEWARALLGFSWEEAYQAAAAASIDRLVFLPYLAGERTPLMDADARGGWLGLAARDGRDSMMRAAFEGVAFSLRAGLQALQRAGMDPEGLRLAGGGSTQPWWRQLLADVLRKPLYGVETVDASARGAALLAGLAVGHWRAADLESLEPRAALLAAPAASPGLETRYERYAALYPQLRQWYS